MSKFAMSKFVTREQRAEAMGYDAGCNGANVENCHYSAFETPEEKDAWNRGNERGLRESSLRTLRAAGESK